MKVIEFIGAPGRGKTTSAMALTSNLKANTTLRVKYIPEYASSEYIDKGITSIWELPTLLIQSKLLVDFYSTLIQVSKLKPDVIITDGGPHNCLLHAEMRNMSEDDTKALHAIVNSVVNTPPIRPIRADLNKSFLDFARVTDEMYSKEFDLLVDRKFGDTITTITHIDQLTRGLL